MGRIQRSPFGSSTHSKFTSTLHSISTAAHQPIAITMTDYFDEHAPDMDPEEQDVLNLRRLRVLAALNGLEVDLDAPSASKAAFEKLPVHKIAKDEEIECPVCKMNGEEGENFKILPCKHEFHEACIVIWLEKTNSCPLCRYELETDDPEYEELRRYRSEERQREERVNDLLDSMFT